MNDIDELIPLLRDLPTSEINLKKYNFEINNFEKNAPIIYYFNNIHKILNNNWNKDEFVLPNGFNLTLAIHLNHYIYSIGDIQNALKLAKFIISKNPSLDTSKKEQVKFPTLLIIIFQLTKDEEIQNYIIECINNGHKSVSQNYDLIINESKNEIIKKLKFDNTITNFNSIDDFEFKNKIISHKEVMEIFSICMSIHEINENLHLSIGSIKNQSFTNFKCYLTIDGNYPSIEQFLKKQIKNDQRFVIIKKFANRGTYDSRNLILSISKGIYFCTHDSDDILNRDALKEAFKLFNSHSYIAYIFNGVRISKSNLLLSPDHNGNFIRLAFPTMCFIKNKVFEKLGFYKEWQHSADSEYINRIKKHFGTDSIANSSFISLLQRDGETNLTKKFSIGSMSYNVDQKRRDLWDMVHYKSKAK